MAHIVLTGLSNDYFIYGDSPILLQEDGRPMKGILADPTKPRIPGSLLQKMKIKPIWDVKENRLVTKSDDEWNCDYGVKDSDGIEKCCTTGLFSKINHYVSHCGDGKRFANLENRGGALYFFGDCLKYGLEPGEEIRQFYGRCFWNHKKNYHPIEVFSVKYKFTNAVNVVDVMEALQTIGISANDFDVDSFDKCYSSGNTHIISMTTVKKDFCYECGGAGGNKNVGFYFQLRNEEFSDSTKEQLMHRCRPDNVRSVVIKFQWGPKKLKVNFADFEEELFRQTMQENAKKDIYGWMVAYRVDEFTKWKNARKRKRRRLQIKESKKRAKLAKISQEK